MVERKKKRKVVRYRKKPGRAAAKSMNSGGSYPLQKGRMRSGGTPYFITQQPDEQRAPSKSEQLLEQLVMQRKIGDEERKITENKINQVVGTSRAIVNTMGLAAAGVASGTVSYYGVKEFFNPGSTAFREHYNAARSTTGKYAGMFEGYVTGAYDVAKRHGYKLYVPKTDTKKQAVMENYLGKGGISSYEDLENWDPESDQPAPGTFEEAEAKAKAPREKFGNLRGTKKPPPPEPPGGPYLRDRKRIDVPPESQVRPDAMDNIYETLSVDDSIDVPYTNSSTVVKNSTWNYDGMVTSREALGEKLGGFSTIHRRKGTTGPQVVGNVLKGFNAGMGYLRNAVGTSTGTYYGY